MPAIKRERGDSSSDGPDSTPTKNKTSFSTKKPRSSSAPSSSSPAKSRLPLEAKRKIAEEIVRCGAGLVDVDKLVRETGLTPQQVKSQLVDNRQNVRKHLMDLARAL